jgi:ribosomal protein L30/L7E
MEAHNQNKIMKMLRINQNNKNKYREEAKRKILY